jgi:hypothetical protein
MHRIQSAELVVQCVTAVCEAHRAKHITQHQNQVSKGMRTRPAGDLCRRISSGTLPIPKSVVSLILSP